MIDSSGVGELVSAHTVSYNRGVRLKLCCLPARITEILTLLSLDTVFDNFDSEEAALRAFA